MLRILARWVPGTTSVIQVAVNGSAMPMPTPQKKRTITKKVKEVQKQDRNPKMEVIIASASKNLYLPYLSEKVYKQEPIDTPRQTIVISRDLSNLSKCHQLPSLGMSKPNTIVQQPSENKRMQSERISFCWPGPNPMRCYRRESMLSLATLMGSYINNRYEQQNGQSLIYEYNLLTIASEQNCHL